MKDRRLTGRERDVPHGFRFARNAGPTEASRGDVARDEVTHALGVVLLTAPWYLFFGGAGQLVLLARVARLARIARLAVTGTRSRKLKELASHVGKAAVYALGLIAGVSLVEKAVEPASSGFTTIGDALWWGFVTFTTVGYGDIIPVTALGRVAAVVLMIGGVAFLGILAGSLSAFFDLDPSTPRTPSTASAIVGPPPGTDASGTSRGISSTAPMTAVLGDARGSGDGANGATTDDLWRELVSLRTAVEALSARLDGPSGH